jgi:hypothetical protein
VLRSEVVVRGRTLVWLACLFIALGFSSFSAFGQDDWSAESALPSFLGPTLDDNSGRTCAPDFVVQSFPYSNTADLRGAGNDCSLLSGEDHIYEIHITQEGLYTFSLCNSPSSINSYIFLTTDCCGGTIIASDNNDCPVYGRSEISCQRLNPATYYLDVEPRDAGGENIYELEIFSCPDPCSPIYPTDTTLTNGDSTFTWIQRTDENDQAPLYEGPWFDPTMPPGRDPYYGFQHMSWYNGDYAWKHVFPDYNMPGGVSILSAKVYICAWDVDQEDCALENPGEPQNCELDNIYGDGALLNPGFLQGNNDTWSVTTFDVPPAALLDDGILNMFIDIDVWNNHRYWSTELNYSVLEVVYCPRALCDRPPYTPQGGGSPSCIIDSDSLCVLITGPTPADPDNDSVTYTYRWYVRNEYTGGQFVNDENAPPHYQNHESSCIPAQDSEVGDEWRAEIWAVDAYGDSSAQPLVITFPQIVPVCGDPIVGWDFGDLDSTLYPTQNEFGVGPANAIRSSNLAWLGETCTDDYPTPRCIDEDLDDGVVFVDQVWPGCTQVCVNITVTTGPGYSGQHLYLNAWKDGNLNHSFGDTLCNGTAPECIIENEPINGLGPNESVVLQRCFLDPSLGTGGGQFMRFRLTYEPVGCNGFVGVDTVLGETEDYMTDFPLRVELVTASVTPQERALVLSWQTASEQDNDHFEIERRASVGSWTKIGQVPGAGTSSESHFYTFADESVIPGVAYFYRLISVELGGIRAIIYETASPVETVVPEASTYRLDANWPNPFNATTAISYDLERSGPIRLRVFDVLGHEVQVLADGFQEAGHHRVVFDASALPSGIYFYRLDAGNFTETKKMVLMK